MFQRILNAIAGDYNQRQLNKLIPNIKLINDLDSERDSLSDEQIKAKTPEFIARYAAGESLDAMLPEAFATVKQACKRMRGQVYTVKGQEVTWDMVPYDVQLLGGMVLHYGKIAEMKTGEGKTLVATLPVYLNALSKKGVHVVTVNDYLASRDSEWMGHLYAWLGLTAGSITKSTPLNVRRQEYEKDITYVENSELGFDYLRDNLVRSEKDRQLLWRPLNYAIVDEVDSILIDEARTPLIISYPSDEPTEKYMYYSTIVRQLVPCSAKKKVSKGFLGDMLAVNAGEEEEDGDYYIDEKNKNVTLSGLGIAKLERIIGVENIYNDLGYDEIHHIENALRAWVVYQNNKDYIVNEGEILIVDEHTGRTMPGRRYSEGLHQAIEAKEKVEIQRESKTMATITYQNFFKIYEKLAGMTGTATTEGEEFEKIYSLEVLSIPTNKPTIRVDQNDKVFFNQTAKWRAVVDYIRFYHDAGVPMLIGTSSIHTSEYVSDLLRQLGVQHYVLNAKFHQQEAEIVANAGKHRSVVVATNMAGRGTDIKLEKGLHEKVADGYALYAKHILQGDTFAKIPPQGVSFVVYSSEEYEYTVTALQKAITLSDEDIRQAAGQWKEVGIYRLKVLFRGSKSTGKGQNSTTKGGDGAKIQIGAFAEVILTPQNNEKPTMIERDLHYGLFILGTEKHESRRIDNQLRGRAGRQGDPGSSVFFVALDDEIMRKMGGEKIQSVARMLLPKDELEKLELTQSQFTNSILRAQKQMEAWNFSIRKHLFDYDSVINRQRQRIYTKRDEILGQEVSAQQPQDDVTKENLMATLPLTIREVAQFIPEIVDSIIAQGLAIELDEQGIVESMQQETGIADLASRLERVLQGDVASGVADSIGEKALQGGTTSAYSAEKAKHTRRKNAQQDFRDALIQAVEGYYYQKVRGGNIQFVDSIVRMIYLSTIDKYRVDHIDAMQYLRDKVGLYGYAQQDPLIMYKQEAFTKFEQLLLLIKKETLLVALRADYSNGGPNQVVLTQENYDDAMIQKLHEAAEAVPLYDANVMVQKGFDATALGQDGAQGSNQYAHAFADTPKRGVVVHGDDVEVIDLNKPQDPGNLAAKGGKQYGRNDIVKLVGPDGETKEVKYKKADERLAKGWKIQ